MGELAQRLAATGILLVAAFVLFKVVLGALTFMAWVVVAVIALVALVWAARVLI
jgi:hypothetical protein